MGQSEEGGEEQVVILGLVRAIHSLCGCCLFVTIRKNYEANAQFVFAPDPTQTITEYVGAYCYVRPLATIEPTATDWSTESNSERFHSGEEAGFAAVGRMADVTRQQRLLEL